MWRVPLFDLDYGKEEKQAVLDVLEDRWLTMGERTVAFEERFGDFLGAGVHCCALSSCTAALHIALLLAGVGPGDEVIVPSLTFVADLNVVVMCGGTPVLADSKSLTDWNLSPTDVERKIGTRTKAVIALHYGGHPCDMDALGALCAEKEIMLVEDAAHAVGATYKGRPCGTMGDVGCFSFFSNKNLAVGEGGMLVTRSRDLHGKAALYRSHGMTSLTVERHSGKSISYDVLQPGLNYRIDEMRSALGMVQLGKLDANNAHRRRMTFLYREVLSDIQEIMLPWLDEDPEMDPAYHIFPVLIPEEADRAQFMNFMRENGVQTSIHYPFPGEMKYYRKFINDNVPVARKISSRVVTLPLYPGMKAEDVDYVASKVKEYWGFR